MSTGEAAGTKKPNRLAGETSPYLLQHAFNPVDWYPWGEEAFRAARERDVPIFLSIGYSTCHWCHVMERESFENEETARILNEHFVSIKVDREERPDIDEVYMQAAQLLTGAGGWPLSVFLTPDLRPFYAGTYFPPIDAYGRPGFPRLLQAIAQAYRERREDVEASCSDLSQAIVQSLTGLERPGDVGLGTVREAGREILSTLDPVFGGFGSAPKFPPCFALQLLLREYHRCGETSFLDAVSLTLDRMTQGGIFDHIGGGFHRYSTDRQWLVPHFEKMLYDNALIPLVLLEGWQVTKREQWAEAAARTLDFVLRELTGSHGGFLSALDADSEGEEGRFYVWTPEEVKSALGERDGELFCLAYGITPEGNFEHGRSIPHLQKDLETLASELGLDPDGFKRDIARMREILLNIRSRRVPPHLDDKVNVSWNGLMIRTLAFAARVLDRPGYLDGARRAASFILDEVLTDGGLAHSWRDGRAALPAFQEDYACLLLGLVELYQADFDVRWLNEAERLGDEMISLFLDREGGGFYSSRKSHETPLVRSKSPTDGVTPSGNSAAALALARLGRLLGRQDFLEIANQTVQTFGQAAARAPRAFEHLLIAVDYLETPSQEIVLAGDPDTSEWADLRAVTGSLFLPWSVLAFAAGTEDDPAPARGKMASDRRATAYVCRDFACRAPVCTASDLEAALTARD
ncbi:MAG: thioredoxin domain-containing protein [Armatimonadota bacterium]|nr:MAG: thioredoxin domain-containing protein [Armatimonadota bacterium]